MQVRAQIMLVCIPKYDHDYRLESFQISSKSVRWLSRKSSMHASFLCVLVHAYLCLCMHRLYKSAHQNRLVGIGSKDSKFRQNLFMGYQENAPCTLHFVVCLCMLICACACTDHTRVHNKI